MNKVSISLFGLFLLMLLSFAAYSQTTLIHYWHFNNTLPSDGSGGIIYHAINADYSVQTTPGIVAYKAINEISSDTGIMDNCNGKTKNERIGFGGCCGTINNGVRTRNPSDNMQFLWYASTENYTNIVITYATESSSFKSGQHSQVYSYSIDGGQNFITTGLPQLSYVPDTTWKTVKLDLSTIASISNNNKFVFRITYTAPNTDSKGNNRYDNITVEGDTLIGNDIKENETEICSIFPNPANEFVQISTPTETNKTIELFSPLGAMITKIQFSGKLYKINTFNLSPGFYYINVICENNTESHKLKFIKK